MYRMWRDRLLALSQSKLGMHFNLDRSAFHFCKESLVVVHLCLIMVTRYSIKIYIKNRNITKQPFIWKWTGQND